MQNQLQYSANFSSQHPSNPLNSPKLTSPTNQKGFDKTLPTMNIKHYSSNPNLSLDANGMKTSGIMNDSNTFSPNTHKKNNEFRSPPSHTHYAYMQNHTPQRPSKNLMTQSLIINDNPSVDVPEETSGSKKEIFKNPPKKQYRLSETIDDIPQNAFLPKR